MMRELYFRTKRWRHDNCANIQHYLATLNHDVASTAYQGTDVLHLWQEQSLAKSELAQGQLAQGLSLQRQSLQRHPTQPEA